MNQDRFNGAVCVGSCGLYRRAAVEPFGGVAAISHSEDMYTGFKMTEIGYKVRARCSCREIVMPRDVFLFRDRRSSHDRGVML